MDHLDHLEAQSIYILREAYSRIKPLAMLWSIGKDSTALLYLTRKAFLGRVPFPIVHLDTEQEFDEVYAFREKIVQEWALPFEAVPCPSEADVDQTLPPNSRAAARKTEGLKNLITDRKYGGLIVGIRRDEQSMRAKERFFSPRDKDGKWNYKEQPPEFWGQFRTNVPVDGHVRVHPLLQWSELDIWRYTLRENIPYVPLYLSQNGMRFRSLGEKNITVPVKSDAATIEQIIAELETTRTSERDGRTMDKESEDSFERLRNGGYL